MAKGFIIDDLNHLKKKLHRLPNVAGAVARNYFKGRISKGLDVNDQAFKPRKYTTERQKGKKILQNTTNMREALRILEISDKRILVGIADSDKTAPYADAHNEGATIDITPKMRKYFWAMATKHKGTGDGNFYRALALKKTPIVIPQRGFIGNSAELEREIDQAIRKFVDSNNPKGFSLLGLLSKIFR